MSEVHFEGKVAQKAIICKDKKVLLVRDPRFAGFVWELPGGRMNEAEEPKAALQRELHEELGVLFTIGRVLHMEQYRHGKGPGYALLIVYEAAIVNEHEQFKLSEEEICEIGWFEAAEIGTMNIFPEHRRAIDLYYQQVNSLQ